MMHIDQETYKIPKDNYFKTLYNKEQLIISSSLRKEDYHIRRLKHKNRGQHKNWNTYTINRIGNIFEHYPPKFYTDFIGVKKVDKKSISIVLENMGTLNKLNDNEYVNSLNELCDPKLVGEKKWLGQKYWEIYSKEQIDSLSELIKYLCKNFEIQLRVIDFHHKHDQIQEYNGIVFKSNYFENSNNINPYLNIENLNELIIK